MNELREENQLNDVFSRKFTLLTILCMAPVFAFFTFIRDAATGRAAAICAGVFIIAVRASGSLTRHRWFWMVITILGCLHLALVLLIPWTSASYPGLTLLPIGVADFLIVYGAVKVIGKAMKRFGHD